jgi:hypothetical protein
MRRDIATCNEAMLPQVPRLNTDQPMQTELAAVSVVDGRHILQLFNITDADVVAEEGL